MGAHLKSEYGFRSCCDIIALMIVCSSIFYFLLSFDKTVFRMKTQNTPKVEQLNFVPESPSMVHKENPEDFEICTQ